MSKRVFIIHGWDGSPEEGWFPWLKQELEQREYIVFVPAMPETEDPKITVWVDKLRSVVGVPDKETYFVGHSIGCQTILRYLEALPVEQKVGGVVFVAGWLALKNLEEDDVLIAKPWLETAIDFEKVELHTNKMVAIFSDNDSVVPFEENKKFFTERVGAKVIVESQKGHFNGSDGITELPSALNSLLEF